MPETRATPGPLIQAAPSQKAQRIEIPPSPRLARMRWLSRLLDNSIALPGGYRIGIDPIIGLVPGIGEFISSTMSAWLIYDAARLGLKKRVLARMTANVLLESVAGSVPVLGDVADAVWKANARNMRLVEQHYSPAQPGRSRRKLAGIFIAVLLAIYGTFALALYLAFRLVMSLFS